MTVLNFFVIFVVLYLKNQNISCENSTLTKYNITTSTEKTRSNQTQVDIPPVHPEITDYSTVINGTNFTALCRVKGVPKPIISWLFKPKGSEVFNTIQGSEENLNILELSLRDSGVYKCIATNLLGQTEQDINVIVEEHPTIINEVNNYFGVEGDLVLQILCNVTGFPEPAIVWKEEGKTIRNDSKYVVNGNVLYIQNLVISDTHNFTCEATNKLGSDIAILYIEVTNTFGNHVFFYGDTQNVYVEQGKPLIITCTIVNSDSVSVRWYRNGQKTSQTGNAYVIEKTTVLDDGNYTCRMNTNEGCKSETFVLDVGMAPVFENDSPSPITVYKHEVDQFFNCTTFSEPAAKIEWSYNGIKAKSLYDMYSSLNYFEWAEVTCTVSNIFGSIQKTFMLIKSGCYVGETSFTQNIPLFSDIDKPSWPYAMSNNGIQIEKYEEIKLSCPNDTNYSNAFELFSSKVEVIVECDTKDTFIINGKPYRHNDLQCKRVVEPSILNTSEQCSGPQSEMIRVGFPVNDFLEAFKVCYDRSRNVPLYASAPIIFSLFRNVVDPLAFQWKPAPGLGDGKPTGGFTCGASNKCCYAKDQLLNVNELAFGTSQQASFIENLNSIAVWNPCEDSNRTSWQQLVKAITETSPSSVACEANSLTWAGASDYVSKNGGLVPRYLWKVLKHEFSSSVMVYINDESPVVADIRCTNTCSISIEFNDPFIYCCNLDEFTEVFGIPSDGFICHNDE